MTKQKHSIHLFIYFLLCLFLFISPLHASSLNPLENVVHFSPSSTGIYLGSPSIVRTPNGDLLVSMDMFGPKAPLTAERNEKIGLVFRSKDDGKTWRCAAEIPGCHWANLFVHKGAVYLLGCSTQFGSIVIRKSEDNGEDLDATARRTNRPFVSRRFGRRRSKISLRSNAHRRI